MFNNYEIVEYTHSLPLQIQNFTGRTIQDDRGDIKDVLEHWHQERLYIHLKDMHYITSMEKFTGQHRENYSLPIQRVFIK
jgi:hypothetical protein